MLWDTGQFVQDLCLQPRFCVLEEGALEVVA